MTRLKAFQIDTVDLAADPAFDIANISLDDITDVTLTGSPTSHAESEMLSYDSGTSQWVNRTIPVAGGATLSTGSFTGGEIQFGTPNGSPPLGSPYGGSPQPTTTFTITAGSGIVVDNHTDPENPTYNVVVWSEFLDQTVTAMLSAERTYIGIDSTGSVVQSSGPFTAEEHRDNIILGRVGHVGHTIVHAVRSTAHAAFDGTARLVDLAEAIGSFNVTGNIYGNNGANLEIHKTSGESYRMGNNFQTSKKSPDITIDPEAAAPKFNYSYLDGAGGHIVSDKTTTVDSNFYDDGSGTLAAVPTNQWQVQLIKFFPGVTTVHHIEYGQTVYGTKAQAIDAIPDYNHEHNPGFSEGVLRGFLVVGEAATDLSNLTQAEFLEAGRFGAAGAVGSASPSVFTSAFESAELTITANTDILVPHSLGIVPAGAQAFVRCISAEFGYDPADGVELEFMNYDGTNVYKGLHVDDIDIHWVTGPNIAITQHEAAGSPAIGSLVILTPAKWKIILRAYA